MAEYIEREAAIEKLNKLCDRVCQYSKAQRKYMCGACPLGDAFTVIEDDIPAADVRHVVLCRDCEYWKQWDNTTHYLCTYVAGAKFIRNAEDFCSRGAKREES